MNCYYHQDREAVGMCISCGKPVCSECKVILKEKFYCNACIEKLFPESTKPVNTKGANWFNRHLNWTAILGFVAGYITTFIIAFLIGIILAATDPYTPDETYDALGWLISIIITLAVAFPIAGWTLKKKCRSLWWLLIFFVPFGWIAFLCLENKNEISDFPKILVK